MLKGALPPLQLLFHCLPTLLRQNPSTSLITFSSYIVFGYFHKGLFDLMLSGTSHPTSTYFMGVCAASHKMAKILPVGQALGKCISSRTCFFNSLRGVICCQNQTAALVQPNCIGLSGLDASKGYQNFRKRISSE